MGKQGRRLCVCGVGLLSLLSVLAAATALGTNCWVQGSILCQTGALLVNASGGELDKFTGSFSYGLFHGQRVRQCGLGGRALPITFFPALLSAIPVGLHVTVLLLAVALITFALLATVFSLVNAFGSPYETLHGPTGLYLWNFIAGGCGLLVMILFAAEVKVHRLSERIANQREEQFVFLTRAEAFGFSFWLLSVCSALHCASACLLAMSGARLPFPMAARAGAGAGSGGVDLMY